MCHSFIILLSSFFTQLCLDDVTSEEAVVTEVPVTEAAPESGGEPEEVRNKDILIVSLLYLSLMGRRTGSKKIPAIIKTQCRTACLKNNF